MINREDLLFDRETKMLAWSKDEAANGQYDHCGLLPKFQALIQAYEDLLVYAMKATKIGDAQGSSLKDREYKIRSLLDNSNQGFLTFGQTLVVHQEYSAVCDRIFGERVGRKSILDLVCTSRLEKKQYERIFHAAFQGEDQQNLHLLPSTVSIRGRAIQTKYRLIQRSDEEPAIMAMLTDVTEKVKFEQQVEYLSEHDSLTSLYNRAFVEKTLPRILRPEFTPVSIILADMNALKLTNDVFGHQKGDELIVEVARILQHSCRTSDIVARWGGDEFLILLPNTDRAQCQDIAAKIKRACEEADPEIVDISISIGTATMEKLNVNITQLFAAAENRMYKNKLLDNRTVRKRIVEKMEGVLESKSIVSPGHIQRMKRRVVEFAKLLGHRENSIEVANLVLLASLHDAGKVALPQDLLMKAERLTADEFTIMSSYTEIGYRMAQSIGEPAVAEAILALREQWDGNGYPTGMMGEQIPYIARVFTLPEVFDVMTHETVYRPALSRAKALEEIKAQRGLRFDPTLTDAFMKYVLG